MLAGLVSDYEKYKTMRNVSFIGVCSSMTATVRSMTQQVEQFKLKPFANMLDTGGTTAAAFGVPRNAAFHLVVVDGAGNIAFNASTGLHWTSGPDAGKYVHHTQVEASLKECKGIIGDVNVPATLSVAAHLYDLQQFKLVDLELNRLMQVEKSSEAKMFSNLLKGKIADSRKARLLQIQNEASSDPLQGYRDASAFIEAFPGAPEEAAVKAIGAKLIVNPKVKPELDAEAGFQRIMVPEMKRALTTASFNQKIAPLLTSYLQAFNATQYADIAKTAVESHRLAIIKGGK